jgi:hypothetical protein
MVLRILSSVSGQLTSAVFRPAPLRRVFPSIAVPFSSSAAAFVIVVPDAPDIRLAKPTPPRPYDSVSFAKNNRFRRFVKRRRHSLNAFFHAICRLVFY